MPSDLFRGSKGGPRAPSVLRQAQHGVGGLGKRGPLLRSRGSILWLCGISPTIPQGSFAPLARISSLRSREAHLPHDLAPALDLRIDEGLQLLTRGVGGRKHAEFEDLLLDFG